MQRQPIRKQLQMNAVALISLVVAVSALFYTAWREETTEKNRTLRTAGFEVLKNLGELQVIVNHAYYQHDSMKGNPYEGWGRILLVSDLSEILPPPVPNQIEKLRLTWSQHADQISTNQKAVEEISTEIDQSRASVLEAIRHLR